MTVSNPAIEGIALAHQISIHTKPERDPYLEAITGLGRFIPHAWMGGAKELGYRFAIVFLEILTGYTGHVVLNKTPNPDVFGFASELTWVLMCDADSRLARSQRKKARADSVFGTAHGDMVAGTKSNALIHHDLAWSLAGLF